MRSSGAQVLCVICIAITLAGPSFGGSKRILGAVVATAGVTVGGVAVHGDNAVLAGDLLNTPAGASASVKFPGARQVEVLPESSVRFLLDAAGRPLAQISAGTVVTTTTEKGAVIVKTAKYDIAPTGRQRVVYFVGVLPDHATVIGARRGAVAITDARSGQIYMLAPGHYVAFSPTASGLPPQQQEQSQQAPGKPAGQGAPPAPQPEKSVQAPGKQAGSAAPPPPPPAPPPWHIGSLSHGASIGVVIAVAAGAAGGALAAASGGGGAPASPSAP
ncbi:MAG: hypothetical protein ACRD1N_06545 [Terriglobia bacterium]